MLSQPHQSDPQRGQPLGDGPQKNFALNLDGSEAVLSIAAPAAPGSNQSWRLLLITLVSCFAASSAALGAFLWLINLPPTANCENTATVTTDRAQLFCAQTAAESGELSDVMAALTLVNSWTEEHPLYYEVQPLIEQWSWIVLKAADQELRANGSMAQAQALVSHIPQDSSVFAQAQETMTTWQAEWQQGEAILAKAQAALQQKAWPVASQQVLALGELKNPHWRVEQVQALSQQIRQERRAQELLDQAIATATPGGSDRLGAALRTASQIDEGTYVRQQAQPYLNRWSDLLLKLGLDKWYASDLSTAIDLGRSAALNPSRAQAAQELIWLSQSRQMAQQSLVTWRTSPDQLVKLYQAMLMANRVPRSSPYYPQAQSSVTTWRGQLGNLAQLQTAQAIGQVHSIDALRAAIDQAAQVPLGHPRRVQAQTMVAHWRQEIERLEDRPQMVRAHELARTKTFDGLRQAIQTANGIPLHRALRGEAQSWAYVWTNELQVMEDQPMLDQARSLAAQGNLFQAIAAARGVKPGRALYGDARAAIARWQGEIAAAERARLQALQRAIAPPVEVAPEIPVDEPELSTEEGLNPAAEGLPLAPATTPAAVSPSQRPWGIRSRPLEPLPDRIQTVPGDDSPPATLPPVLPRSPQAPAAPAAESAAENTAPAIAPALTTPAPVSPAIASPAPVTPPTPVAPQPVDLVPIPAPETTTEPQAAAPALPTVSTKPQPETIATLKVTWPATPAAEVLVSSAPHGHP